LVKLWEGQDPQRHHQARSGDLDQEGVSARYAWVIRQVRIAGESALPAARQGAHSRPILWTGIAHELPLRHFCEHGERVSPARRNVQLRTPGAAKRKRRLENLTQAAEVA
jgi:hypothetical protein